MKIHGALLDGLSRLREYSKIFLKIRENPRKILFQYGVPLPPAVAEAFLTSLAINLVLSRALAIHPTALILSLPPWYLLFYLIIWRPDLLLDLDPYIAASRLRLAGLKSRLSRLIQKIGRQLFPKHDST